MKHSCPSPANRTSAGNGAGHPTTSSPAASTGVLGGRFALQKVWLYAIPGVLLLFLAVHSFPGQYTHTSQGLDPSYQWGFNFVNNSEYLFGKDVVYTYGPLGYLIWPLDLGNNLWHAMLLRVAIHGLFMGAVCYLTFSIRSPVYVLLFVPMLATAYALGLRYEYQLIIVPILLAAACMNLGRSRYPLQFVAGAYAAMLLLMKFNAGIAAIPIVFFTPLLEIHTNWKKTARSLVVTGAGYIVAMLVLVLAYFRTAHIFVSWLHQSLLIAGDYSEAMSFYNFPWGLPASLLCVGVYAALCGWLIYRKSWVGFFALILVPTVFFAFKHGNVRQVGLALSHLFTYVLAVLSIFTLLLGVRRESFLSAVCAYLVVLACTLMLAIYPPAERVPPEFAADLLGSTGVSHIYSLLNFRQVQEDLREAGKKKLEIDVLPQTWVDRIKAANSTVDTIPWEISYVPANDLRWIPNPTFQLFEAYNRPLDAREAAHFANAATAPDYLIWDYSTHTVDSRCALWDPPLTIQTIVQCYAPTSVEVGPRPRLLLARRPQSLHEELKTIKTDPIPESAMSLTTESVSSVVAVPDSPKRVYTSLDMKLTPLGQIVKFLYRVPPVYMGIVLRNHQSLVFHIIPDIAHEPMIIDSLPQQPQGLAELFANKGKSEDRTAAFALIGQGLRFYSKPIHVTWYEGMEFSEHHDK